MHDYPYMADQLKNGIFNSCFCFGGVMRCPDPLFPKSPDIDFPICSSTVRPFTGGCNRLPKKISKAGMSGIVKSKPKKTFIGTKEVKQLHFNDYLKQLKQERNERTNSHG